MISDGARLHQKLPKNCFFGCNQPRLLVSSMCLLEIRMHFSKACKHQVSNSCFFKSRTKTTFVDSKSTADLGRLFNFFRLHRIFSRVNMCWPVTWIKTIAVLGDQWHVFLKGLSCQVKYSHLTRCDAMDPPGAPSWGNGRTWVSISC